MLRIALALLIGAFLLEFGRSQIIDFVDSESIIVRIEGVDQLCVVQRKNTGTLFRSSLMPCATAQARTASASGLFAPEVAYVSVAHFSFRSPVDQRIYTGVHRTQPALTPPVLGPTLEIRASKVAAGQYKVVN